MNPKGKAYCKLQIGDPKGQAALSAYKSHLKLADVCNTVRRSEEACKKLTKQWERVFYTDYDFYFFSVLQGNDACTKQIYHSAYWELSGAWVLGPLVLAWLL
jgi:hypothetical protein